MWMWWENEVFSSARVNCWWRTKQKPFRLLACGVPDIETHSGVQSWWTHLLLYLGKISFFDRNRPLVITLRGSFVRQNIGVYSNIPFVKISRPSSVFINSSSCSCHSMLYETKFFIKLRLSVLLLIHIFREHFFIYRAFLQLSR